MDDIFFYGCWCGHFSNYMGHWCLKKSDCMGGGVLLENQLLTFDRYIKWNIPVSIKISNPNLPVCLKSSNLHINKFTLCKNETKQSCFTCL